MLPHSSAAGNNRSENPGPPVPPAALQALERLLASDAETWGDAGSGLQVVKQSTVRTVLRGEVGPAGARQQVHVKLYRTGRLSDRVRDAATGSRGELEATHLRLLRGLGLPAVVPLAAGAQRGTLGARSYLVTASVADAAPFRWQMPAEVLQRIGALIRRLHDQGLDLPDLHPGNVVLDGSLMPWLLDVTALQKAALLDLRVRARSLAVFCLELQAGPLDPAARPLLSAYRDGGPPLPAAFTVKLAQAARAARLRGLVAFGRRAGRACRHTEVERGGGSVPHWFWFRSGDAGLDQRLRASAQAFVEVSPPPDAEGRRGAVWLLDELAVKQRPAAKARALFRGAYWCTFAGVRCAVPVALRLLHGQGFVFGRRVGPRNLREELAHGALTPREVAAAAHDLGALIGRIHAHGLRHRDLKFENLVREPGSGALAVVDLDGLRHKRPTDRRGQGHDLGRVLAAWQAAGEPGGGASVRVFVRAYLRARRRLLQPASGRHLWTQAARRAGQWHSAHR